MASTDWPARKNTNKKTIEKKIKKLQNSTWWVVQGNFWGTLVTLENLALLTFRKKKKNHNKNRGEVSVVKVNRNQTRCHSNWDWKEVKRHTEHYSTTPLDEDSLQPHKEHSSWIQIDKVSHSLWSSLERKLVVCPLLLGKREEKGASSWLQSTANLSHLLLPCYTSSSP